MASPLIWKVYHGAELFGATRHAEDAAAMVALGGSTVKHEGRVVWREGREQFSAGESYDRAAGVMHARARQHGAEYARKHLSAADRAALGI